jgi:hypothetical protein
VRIQIVRMQVLVIVRIEAVGPAPPPIWVATWMFSYFLTIFFLGTRTYPLACT